MVPAEHVVADHPEVILADMGELRASSDFSDRPHTRSGCLEALVHLDVSVLCQLYPGELQPDVFRVRYTPGRDQEMRAFERLLRPFCSRVTRTNVRILRRRFHLGIQNGLDAFI